MTDAPKPSVPFGDPRKFPKLSRLERLYMRVKENGDCHEWMGPVTDTGHGSTRYHSEKWSTHRLAWHLQRGPIPSGLFVLHTCHNPRCINVDHLYLGTQKDNMQDMFMAGRQPNRRTTTCRNGHAWTDSNTYHNPSGKRLCTICDNARRREARRVRAQG